MDEPPVRRRLIVTWSLEPSGAARQLTLLAAALPRPAVRVVVLGTETPWAEALRRQGVTIDVLGWRRTFDLRPLTSLRRIVASSGDDALHAWGPGAGWSLVAAGVNPGRLTLTAPLPTDGKPGAALTWLLRRCRQVAALGPAEAAACARLGVSSSRLVQLPYGLPPTDEPVVPATLPGLPAGARVIVVPGPVTRSRGQFDAVWALDILAFLHPDLHLVLLGDGADLDRVRHFVHCCRRQAVVHFPGVVPDVRPWLARADLVWLPRLRAGGTMSALEAMAAGKPVIATRVPGLIEPIVEAETGHLVAPGDKTALCRLTRDLLLHPERIAPLCAAARRRAGDFPLTAPVERLRDLDG